jgi:hypothetical protein
MTIYVFGEGVDDDISALEKWGGVEWGEEGVVDEHEGL